MANPPAPTRMVKASDLRAWLLWLCDHYDQELDTPRNREIGRLGPLLEELGRRAGAIDTSGQRFGQGACLLDAFDWEHGEIEFAHPALLTYRLRSADPEALIARLVALTSIPESGPDAPVEPEYAL